MFKNCQEQNRIQPILNIWQLIKFFLKSKKYFVSFRQYKYHASLLYWKLSDSNISFLQCLPIRRMFIEFSSCISMNFIRIRRRDNCCHKFCISSKVFPPILFGWCFALSTHWHQLFSDLREYNCKSNLHRGFQCGCKWEDNADKSWNTLSLSRKVTFPCPLLRKKVMFLYLVLSFVYLLPKDTLFTQNRAYFVNIIKVGVYELFYYNLKKVWKFSFW